MRRRTLLPAPLALLLAGCGFQLRQPPKFAFHSFYTGAPASSPLVTELKRQLASTEQVQVLTEPAGATSADVVLDVLNDVRERVIVGVNAVGQVRELQLRVRFKFRLRTPRGKVLIPDTELLLQRDVSYSEAAALAKEAEEALLYRDMQGDIVQQLMRRFAAVREL